MTQENDPYDEPDPRTRPTGAPSHWVTPPPPPTSAGQPLHAAQPEPEGHRTNPNAQPYPGYDPSQEATRITQPQAPQPQAAQPQAPRPPAATPVPAMPASAAPGQGLEVPSATDFLDRRAETAGFGPANWGWRGALRRMSGGMISPKMGPDEVAYEQDRAMIQRDFDGPRTIVFINPKGGAAKTTGVLAAGYTFGTVRGGGVVAWDNNETRGTLGIRGVRSTHRNTTRELLDNLASFNNVYQSRIGDLGAFVRSQGDAHFDVLASDERPDVTGQIHADDFGQVHHLLERFYKVILVDTGNNMRAENWLAAADTADLLVVTSTVREDTGYSGLWMLDALEESGYADLKLKTITVLSDPSPKVDKVLARDLTDVYQQRTRGVYRVPFDPVLVAGSTVQYSQLSEETRMSWLKACAGMAHAL